MKQKETKLMHDMKKANQPSPDIINTLFWRDILEAIGDPVSIQGTDFRILYQNSRSKEVIGDHAGERCYTAYENRSDVCDGCPLEISFRKGHTCTGLRHDTVKKGLVFEITSTPLRDAAGTIVAGIEVARVISGQLKIEEDLRKFKFISNKASEAHLLTDREGRIVYVNESFCRALGYSDKELLTLNVSDLVPVFDKTLYLEMFDLAQRQTVPPTERQIRRKDGSVFFSEIVVTGYEIDGKPYIFAVFRDVTSRKSIEDVMLKIAKGVSCLVGEKFFHSLAEYLCNILNADYAYIAEVIPGKPNFLRTLSFIADGKNIDNMEVDIAGTPCEKALEDNICLCPSGVQSLFPHARIMAAMKIEGYVGKLLYSSSGTKLGLVAVMYRKPVEHVAVVESTLRIFAARAAAEIERRQSEELLRRTNAELEMRVRDRTLELQNANEYLKEQIEKLKMARNALEVSETRFRTAATCIADLIWEGDVRTDSLHWFGDIDGMLGYEVGEFPRTISGLMENIHQDDRVKVVKAVKKALKAGKEFSAEYRIRSSNGTYHYWYESGKPVEFENLKPVKWVGSITDITNHKTAEQHLKESEHKYKALADEFNALLDAIPDSLILLSPDLKILWANKAFATNIGKKVSGIKGQHCYNLCCKIDNPCRNCPVIVSLKSGKEETTRVMNTAGRIFNKRAFPIKDKKGEIRNVIEVTRDITAKVHMEEEAKLVQSRLIHTNKMTSLGTLVSGVAHEINNPNSFILNNTQVFAEIWEDAVKLLSEHYQSDKSIHLAGIPFSEVRKLAPKLLYGINDGSLRIKNIVDNLKNFSRPDKARMDGKVDINTIIMTSTSILENQIKKFTNNYQVKCEDNLPFVKGSAQQIEQVVINLIMNALQSLPDKEAGISVFTKYNKRANRVEIRVADEGCGIDRKIIDRVTEPFFTTKYDIGGTGLGLSITDSIIREHNGSLIFKSNEGKGTIITVRLPLYESI
ncbi:MAG: PAS domain S-box protein [Nitrospiraceae bacterium]|nr:MAG: PAS domain S-box protein [Nitrospiraceae bacterium]